MKIWIWNAAAIVTLSALAFAFSGSPKTSRLAPYPFDVTPPADPDADLAFLEQRPPGGLDLAALSRALLKRGRIQRGEEAARRSLEILPVSNPGAILALAKAAQMKHDFAGSIAYCDRVLRDRPRDASALSLKTTAQLGLGDLAGAIRSADALVDRSPISEHLALRAVVLAARGDEREALHDFKRACALEEPGDLDGSAWTRSMWARLALQRGRTDDAEDLLREALRIRPFNATSLGILGDLELYRGRPEEADRAYAAAYQACGDPAFLARRPGVDRDAAEKAMRESGGHPIALARLLLGKGAATEALAIAESEARSRRNAETLEVLARASLATGRLPEARAAVREAIRSGALDSGLHLLAAEIESRLGCASRAAMHRETAREIRP
jgi:tetratricopeptide (TPR) repeat protein